MKTLKYTVNTETIDSMSLKKLTLFSPQWNTIQNWYPYYVQNAHISVLNELKTYLLTWLHYSNYKQYKKLKPAQYDHWIYSYQSPLGTHHAIRIYKYGRFFLYISVTGLMIRWSNSQGMLKNSKNKVLMKQCLSCD